jgi:NitT/TauT family transport system substrate-binding protein
MDKNGGDSSTVRFVEMPADAIAEALDKGRVDSGSMPEPFVSAARPLCRALANPYDAIGDGFMIAGWFASTVWADEHPDLVRRFVTAMREAAVWANKNPAQSLPILVKYIKLDPSVGRGVVRARFGETLVASTLQPPIDVAAHYKLIDATYPASEIMYKPKR